MTLRRNEQGALSVRSHGLWGSGSFRRDYYPRPEIKTYVEEKRSYKAEEPSVSVRPFIIEQEAARLHCYGLIGAMNELGIWGKS